ncbi:uncharacterized protein K489DRAFT_299268, partial [Dissoconium aciculare CBS 342.82]|uniref:SET domain-containing protein n=1 Tax=Dissoconium aciculare CBS 342.82 TaxID=1314786 RepID=A0A6J3MEN9_9PEZI
PIWRTIQTSKNTHTDPRSALLYMNHSCQPSLLTEHGLAGEVKIARDRDIKKGDHLTFFYPSTEWAMDRPFDCLCGAPEGVCLSSVQGSKYIPNDRIGQWFVNDHILSLKK